MSGKQVVWVVRTPMDLGELIGVYSDEARARRVAAANDPEPTWRCTVDRAVVDLTLDGANGSDSAAHRLTVADVP